MSSVPLLELALELADERHERLEKRYDDLKNRVWWAEDLIHEARQRSEADLMAMGHAPVSLEHELAVHSLRDFIERLTEFLKGAEE